MDHYKRGQIAVMFKKGLTEEEMRKIIEDKGLFSGRYFSFIRTLMVGVPYGQEVACCNELNENVIIIDASCLI